MCQVQQPTQRLSPLVGKQSNPPREENSSPVWGWHFAAVFSGYFVGCMQMQCRPAVSRVTEHGPRPCWDPRGSSCCPAQGFSHHSRDCVTPEHQSTPHRDLHHESMSKKFVNTFPIPTNPEYNWFEELLKMLSDRAGQGLKTP